MSTSSLYESVWKIMDRSEAVAQVPAPLGKAPQLNASIEALLDGIDAPAFPNEAFSVVSPMRNAQAPDTCRTSKGATTRLAACAYLCGNQKFDGAFHRRDACSMAWWGSFLTARPSQDGKK